MAARPPSQQQHRSDKRSSVGVSLPVVRAPKIRKSKSGKRRAAVLIVVHLLIAIHVAHWLSTGSTLTPLEPSEAMEFSKHSIVNAGLIFFALTVLSTLVFGRWLCGWGCHLVALQDLARWILGKLKIKPRPARMGILALVPLVAFVYMFFAPVVYRLLAGDPLSVRTISLTTETLWATLPGWTVSALTFLTCGFVIIYLMGAKAFCTYGCPYGAIYGIADQLSPWHIRVTDACRGCGHCTAVCTSNVRVHQEVRDFGMVVDPGCMKCTDCVSVCPNDALYFGFGKPALFVRRRSTSMVPQGNGSGLAATLPHWILAAGFIFAAFGLFMWYDNDFDWWICSILTAGSLVAAAIFKGKSKRLAEYSLAEEALMCAIFLLSIFAFRGLYGAVPFLFCLGLSAILAYWGIEFVRLTYKPNRSIHRWQLKRRGQLVRAGYVFVVFMLTVGGFGAHAGLAQYDRLVKPRQAHGYFVRGMELARQDRLDEAIDMFERAIAWQSDYIEARENLAGMYCAVGRYQEGIEQYGRALEQNPDDAGTYFFLARAYAETHRFEQAKQQLRRAIELAPQWQEPQALLNELCAIEAGGQSRPTSGSVEQEVLQQVQQQPIGSHTVAALNLPQDFLRRVVDRIIRSSYQQRYHVVVQDDKATALPGEAAAEPADAHGADDSASTAAIKERYIKIQRAALPHSISAYRGSLAEVRPPLRGFRAPVLVPTYVGMTVPFTEPGASVPQPIRQAADVVGARLAHDGLLATLARVMEIVGPAEFTDQAALPKNIQLLRRIGLPVDLLAFFATPGQIPMYIGTDAHAIVPYIGRRLVDGVSAEALRADLGKVPFAFTKSRHDFRVATESGEHDIALVRLQITRGSYWRGIGAGGSIDIARQLVSSFPDASFVVSIEEKHLQPFVGIARRWPLRREGQLTISAEPMVVAQWAQDNGKAGVVGSEQSDTLAVATLVPRYASRREDGTVFIPGESFLADGLAGTGHVVVQSPLLFQGGNLLAIGDPKSTDRILLIGEAEVYRNTALGLTPDQVLQAFRLEFGVDRCLVLPAVSFHIDFDLTVRAHNGQLIAFVNDSDGAVRIILELGIAALEAHGTLDAKTAQTAKAHLQAGRSREFLSIVLDPMFRQSNPQGQFPLSLANFFSASTVDSPVGNFQRFLLALDILASSVWEPEELPDRGHLRAYMRSFKRRRAERQALHEQLRRLGFAVVGVPSLADADRSINYLNGLHDRERYLMPAYGGFYAPLDRAAATVFEAELDGVAVIPVLCGESQRRVGAIHCSVCAYPRY